MRLAARKTDERALPLVTAYRGDAGIDLPILEHRQIAPGEGCDVPTGWAISLPVGHYGRIVGRSSALRKKGVLVVEGIIDNGFRGELFSYVFNPGTETVYLSRGESVAQLIVSPVPYIVIDEVDELPESERGTKGFGSSGR